jgi:hypothetical protein
MGILKLEIKKNINSTNKLITNTIVRYAELI